MTYDKIHHVDHNGSEIFTHFKTFYTFCCNFIKNVFIHHIIYIYILYLQLYIYTINECFV